MVRDKPCWRARSLTDRGQFFLRIWAYPLRIYEGGGGSGRGAGLRALVWPWALSIQLEIPEIQLVRNQMERIIFVQSNRNIWRWSTLTNLVISASQTKMFLVPLFNAPLTRTITKCAVAWVLCSVQLGCAVPLGTWNFKLDFLWNERASCDHAKNYKLAMVNVHVIQNKSFGYLHISLVLLFFCFRSFMLFVFVTNWLLHKGARLWDKTGGVSGYFALVFNPGKILGKLRETLPYYLDHEGVTEVQTSGNLRFEDSLLINCTYPPPPTKWPSSQIMHGLGHYMKSYTKYITQIQYT